MVLRVEIDRVVEVAEMDDRHGLHLLEGERILLLLRIWNRYNFGCVALAGHNFLHVSGQERHDDHRID